jgi:hypothetical protein
MSLPAVLFHPLQNPDESVETLTETILHCTAILILLIYLNLVFPRHITSKL